MVPLPLYAHVRRIASGRSRALSGLPDLASQLRFSRKEVKTRRGRSPGKETRLPKRVVKGRASRIACPERSRRVHARVDRRSDTERNESLVDSGVEGAKKPGRMQIFCGDPGGSRTPNPQFRRLMLYPVELRGRRADCITSCAGLETPSPHGTLCGCHGGSINNCHPERSEATAERSRTTPYPLGLPSH